MEVEVCEEVIGMYVSKWGTMLKKGGKDGTKKAHNRLFALVQYLGVTAGTVEGVVLEPNMWTLRYFDPKKV